MDRVKAHYEHYVYPQVPRLASIRGCDAYALNLEALWAWFTGQRLPPQQGRILLAGCGSFSPYPTAVANWRTPITALDFSRANLRRARQHTWLHGYFNVTFVEGDVLQATEWFGEKVFHFIDCYGVIHHIRDDLAALRTLHALLKPGGFVRLMVYSRGARHALQAARWALRLLDIREVAEIRALYRRAQPGSRFRKCLDGAPEATFDAGLADLLLHPHAKTYRLDEWLERLHQAGLEPLWFIHPGALRDVAAEVTRLRALEKDRALTVNFMVFAGRQEDAPQRAVWAKIRQARATELMLNPVLRKFWPRCPLMPLHPAPRLGFPNPVIDWRGQRLLARFKRPIATVSVPSADWEAIARYRDALFLMESAVPKPPLA